MTTLATQAALLLLVVGMSGCATEGGAVDAGSSHDTTLHDVAPVEPDADGGAVADTTTPTDTAQSADAGGLDPNAPTLEIVVAESTSPTLGAGSAYATASNPPFTEPVSPDRIVVGDCAYVPETLPVPCEPECVAPEHCGLDGACHPQVQKLDAGTITIEGLKVGVTLEPLTQYLYYTATYTPGEPADGDLFEPGATITASSQGGANVGPFQVSTTGVATLVTPLPCELAPKAGEDLVVTWEPAQGSPVRFEMRSGNHGDQFSRIVCEAPDTGSLTVDGALLAKYLADWRPFESWRLTRSATGQANAAGVRVVLTAMSAVGCSYSLK